MILADFSADWGAFGAVGVMFSILSSVGTWLFTRGGKAALLQQQVNMAQEHLKSAENRADKAEAAYASLFDKLHEHMLSDSAAFSKLEALTAEASRTGRDSELRLTTAVDKLVNRIEGMSERMDRFITISTMSAKGAAVAAEPV